MNQLKNIIAIENSIRDIKIARIEYADTLFINVSSLLNTAIFSRNSVIPTVAPIAKSQLKSAIYLQPIPAFKLSNITNIKADAIEVIAILATYLFLVCL